MTIALLSVFLIPAISIPFVYLVGKKSAKWAAIFVALISLVNILLVSTTIPTILNSVSHRYVESYNWFSTGSISVSFTLFTDGISASIALVSLALILVAAIFSINYMSGKKHQPSTTRSSQCSLLAWSESSLHPTSSSFISAGS